MIIEALTDSDHVRLTPAAHIALMIDYAIWEYTAASADAPAHGLSMSTLRRRVVAHSSP